MNYLNESDQELFYKIHKNLMLFANQKENIVDSFDTVDDWFAGDSDFLGQIGELRKHVYTDPKYIDKFIKQNPIGFSSDELELAGNWKNAVFGSFTLFRHLKKHSIFVQDEARCVYGVLGVSSPLEDIIPKSRLPLMCDTAIIPFKNRIVFDGLLTYRNIYFGGNIKRRITTLYNEIKAQYGITTNLEKAAGNHSTQQERDTGMLKYYLKTMNNWDEYNEEAWELAQKNEANMICYNREIGRLYTKRIKKSMKKNGITGLHVAVYHDCVVGIAKSKKEVETIAKRHVPEKLESLHFFKV
ncbi:MAG: hypothetical protein GY866_27055 [Proteobacteria bacterium]|nr:hypothetical protein [Pseudomonadota bacterium]